MGAVKRILLVFLLLCGGAFAAQAGQGSGFFEALYDVPVMDGLEELKDQAVLFDKPDGKIASVVAASKSLNAPQIEAFYAKTLPQMGWRKTNNNQYIRADEQLAMDISVQKTLTIVQFTLSPHH